MTPFGFALSILIAVVAALVTIPSARENEEKSRSEWRALPEDQRPAHGLVDNSSSLSSIGMAILIVLIGGLAVVYFHL